jgi:hypothetical protein
MGVQNSGFIFIAIVLCALSSCSQIFSGQIGQMLGLVPSSVSAPIRTTVDAASGSLGFFGFVIFILAFFSKPGH